MRKEFIRCKDRQAAKRRTPWAVIVAWNGQGFWAFESMKDYREWKDENLISGGTP